MKLQFMEQLKNSRFAQNTQKVLSSPFFVIAIFCMTFILSVFKLTIPSFIILGLFTFLAFFHYTTETKTNCHLSVIIKKYIVNVRLY